MSSPISLLGTGGAGSPLDAGLHAAVYAARRSKSYRTVVNLRLLQRPLVVTISTPDDN